MVPLIPGSLPWLVANKNDQGIVAFPCERRLHFLAFTGQTLEKE